MRKVIVTALILASFTAMAQERPKSEKRTRNAMNDLTPEQVATLQTKKMTLALDLTEAQQEKIKVIQLNNVKMRKAMMAERKAKKEAEKSRPSAEERYAMANARLDHQIAKKAELKKVLSEAQYKKWEEIYNRKKKRGQARGTRGQKKMKKRN